MAGRFTVEAIFKSVDKVTKPVRRMQSNVQKFTRGAIRGLKKVGRAAAAVGRIMRKGFTAAFSVATIAVTATLLAVRSFTKEADDLVKQARLLDFPLDKLQEWKFAAGQAGLSAEKFDKALEGFVKRTGEARAGTGSMITLLKAQNPELLKNILATKGSAEAFEVLVQGIRDTEGASNKLALANAAGGRSASKLILLAKLHKDELKGLFKEQRENGNITEEQAAQAEKLTDATASMTAALKGLRNNVLEPLLPMLIDAAKAVRQWSIDNRELISGKFKAFLDFVVNNFSEIVAQAKHFLNVAKWIIGIVVALKVLVGILTVVNIVMAANPVVLIVLAIIAAIALVVTAIMLLINNWEDFKRGFVRIWNGILAFFAPVVNALISTWQVLVDFFSDWLADMRTEFPLVFEVIDNVVGSTIKGISKAIELTATLFEATKRVLGLSTVADQEKAATTIAQAVSPSEIALANFTDEERDALDADGRAAFGLPPRSESSASATVTIRDETSGRAELTQSASSGSGSGINLQSSGAF